MNVGSGTLQPRAWHSHTHWGPSLPPLVLRLLGGVTPFLSSWSLGSSGMNWETGQPSTGILTSPASSILLLTLTLLRPGTPDKLT